MKKTLIATILVLLMAWPSGAHGFGILRYTWDFIKDQIGIERGPRPKILRKEHPPRPGHAFQKPWEPADTNA